MSILKMKIARAQELKDKRNIKQAQKTKVQFQPSQSTVLPAKQPRANSQASILSSPRSDTTSSDSRGSTSYKNIVKNYSKAMTKFAISKLATPYLIPLLNKYSVNFEDFKEYISSRRSKINCIKTLREMLLAQDCDGAKVIGIKSVFQEISIVFMKKFSVNWIFNSKISNKLVHLNARFKVLRRIRNPMHFTYLEEFSKKSAERNGYRMKH